MVEKNYIDYRVTPYTREATGDGCTQVEVIVSTLSFNHTQSFSIAFYILTHTYKTQNYYIYYILYDVKLVFKIV